MPDSLSWGQLEQLWINAGGAADKAPIAAAVAMAESGGRNVVSAPNSNGSRDVGYWQINSAHGSGQATLDPMGNARAAVQISANGSNWRPWCTAWTGGCRGTYDPTGPNTPVGRQWATGLAQKASGGTVASPLPTGGDNAGVAVPSDPLTAGFWSHTLDVIGNWFIYVSIGAAGIVLLTIGAVTLFRETDAGKAAIGGVTKVAKIAGMVL